MTPDLVIVFLTFGVHFFDLVALDFNLFLNNFLNLLLSFPLLGEISLHFGDDVFGRNGVSSIALHGSLSSAR